MNSAGRALTIAKFLLLANIYAAWGIAPSRGLLIMWPAIM